MADTRGFRSAGQRGEGRGTDRNRQELAPAARSGRGSAGCCPGVGDAGEPCAGGNAGGTEGNWGELARAARGGRGRGDTLNCNEFVEGEIEMSKFFEGFRKLWKALDGGDSCLVHCLQGANRSPLICGMIIVMLTHAKPEQVMD